LYRLSGGLLLGQRTLHDPPEVRLRPGGQGPGAGGNLRDTARISTAEFLDCRRFQHGAPKNGKFRIQKRVKKFI